MSLEVSYDVYHAERNFDAVPDREPDTSAAADPEAALDPQLALDVHEPLQPAPNVHHPLQPALDVNDDASEPDAEPIPEQESQRVNVQLEPIKRDDNDVGKLRGLFV